MRKQVTVSPRARDVYGIDITSHAYKIPLLGTFRLEGGGKTMQTLCMEILPDHYARELNMLSCSLQVSIEPGVAIEVSALITTQDTMAGHYVGLRLFGLRPRF